MNRIILMFTLAAITVVSSCFQDPLYGIRRISRSENLEKKEEASMLYRQAIDTLVDAYSSYSGLNRDIGLRLMNKQEYEPAIKHLEIAVSIKNNDSSAYFWLASCYSHLYKIRKEAPLMVNAEKNFKIAIGLTPDNREYHYLYAQFLIFIKEDYAEAVRVINQHIEDMVKKAENLSDKKRKIHPSQDPNLYLLLGRAYYMQAQYTDALNTFNDLYQSEMRLTKDQKSKLEEFILQTRKMLNGE
jgi:tetratricopeptide (TPR) repeat protein